MDILSVSRIPSPPVPPVEIQHIDVRFTAAEAKFVGCVMGGLAEKTAELCGATKSEHYVIWQKLKSALGVLSFGSPWLLHSDHKRFKESAPLAFVKVDDVTYTLETAAIRIKYLEEQVAHQQRLLDEQVVLLAKQRNNIDRQRNAIDQIICLAQDVI